MDDNLGEKLFQESLKECLDLRKQRKKIYGNSWFQEDGVEASFWGGIMNKTNRLRVLHKNRCNEIFSSTYEDCLKDLVVLSLFTLACLKYEKSKK